MVFDTFFLSTEINVKDYCQVVSADGILKRLIIKLHCLWEFHPVTSAGLVVCVIGYRFVLLDLAK